MTRFFVLFTVLLIGLFTLEILQPAEKYVILPFTSFIADVSVWVIQTFDDNVMAMGNVIRDKTTGFGVRIERGCNGVEALIILFAAIFSFPAPFKNKIIGFSIGLIGGLGWVQRMKPATWEPNSAASPMSRMAFCTSPGTLPKK